ncbi:MAG: amidohydrolase [Patescibacteria group bacterium]|nr:amidohydrolase [Patescibacteria group bacterium]
MILIKNIDIVTQNKKRQIIKNGAIVIDGDTIKKIGPNKEIEKEYAKQAQKIINGRGQVALPGLINTHTHLAMSLLRGYADDLLLEDWWQNYIYPIESKFSREEVYWGSLLAMLEMIKSGTTCFADFYYYENEVGRAAQEIGMRGILGCAILDFPTFYFKTAVGAFKKIEKLIKTKTKLTDFAVAPHMIQTTSLETYKKAKKIAREHNLLLTTHLGETKQEVNFCLKKYKKRPVELLEENGILDERSFLAHCCWLNKKEIKILARSGASVAHCPVSNMKLASGTMPLKKMAQAGVNVSLGTDGACSNNSLDMFGEMKTAALAHKSHSLDPTLAGAQTVLDMATINGAKALGLDNEIGSLEPCKKADIMIIDFKKPHLTPCHNLVSNIVYAAKGSDVETVIINGKIIMENRKIKGVDEKKVLRKIEKIAKFK